MIKAKKNKFGCEYDMSWVRGEYKLGDCALKGEGRFSRYI